MHVGFRCGVTEQRVPASLQWLYPFSKDAGNPSHAQEAADSYNAYVKEKNELAARMQLDQEQEQQEKEQQQADRTHQQQLEEKAQQQQQQEQQEQELVSSNEVQEQGSVPDEQPEQAEQSAGKQQQQQQQQETLELMPKEKTDSGKPSSGKGEQFPEEPGLLDIFKQAAVQLMHPSQQAQEGQASSGKGGQGNGNSSFAPAGPISHDEDPGDAQMPAEQGRGAGGEGRKADAGASFWRLEGLRLDEKDIGQLLQPVGGDDQEGPPGMELEQSEPQWSRTANLMHA